MTNFFDKNFKTLVIVMLLVCTISVLKQHYDIYKIKRKLSSIETLTENTQYNLNNVKDDLSSEIEDVRRAVILWSN